ncbi:NUDIX hydrolase [Verrucomicrobiota bacterium]|nr:NUDIX hydrolase [Verrucomicrobiota bacterium]
MSPEVGQSPDEVFDVVDAQDRVIGREFRAEIHRRHLRHRAIHIFWLRPDGQLCLQRRSFAKDHCPGLLSSSCAGHVDAGETYVSAATRELAEELGVQVAPTALAEIDYAPCHVELGHEFVRSYLLRRPPEALRLAPFEVDAVRWRYPAEVVAWMDAQPEEFAPPLRHLLARAGVRRALGLP